MGSKTGSFLLTKLFRNSYIRNGSYFLGNNIKNLRGCRCVSDVKQRCEIQAEQPEEREHVPMEVSEKKKIPVKLKTLVDYADQAPIIKKFIDYGVNMHKFTDSPQVSAFILTLNFERDVLPYLQFLEREGVPSEYLGVFITKNPYIFKCSLEDLEVRINYLESKKFTKEMISTIITKNPLWLSLEVKVIDQRLGELQKMFGLSGNDVRSIAVQFPGVVTLKKNIFNVNLFTIKEEMGLSKRECRDLVVKAPKLLKANNSDLVHTLHQLLKLMAIPIDLILKEPRILTCRPHILRIRHKFLVRLGRAQYNPKLPGYVSLNELCSSDERFCQVVAMTSLETFYEFQKTL